MQALNGKVFDQRYRQLRNALAKHQILCPAVTFADVDYLVACLSLLAAAFGDLSLGSHRRWRGHYYDGTEEPDEHWHQARQ